MTTAPSGLRGTAAVLRALLVPAGLALRRARRHPGRWLPAALGIALGVAVLAALGAYGVAVGDRAAERQLAGLRPGERTVRLDWNGGLPAEVDRAARAAVASATPAGLSRSVLLQPARLGRATVRIAGVAPLAPAVRLASGRLPRACGPDVCEVLQVGGPAVGPALREVGVRLVVVGRGRLVTPVPLGFVPGDDAAGRTAREPPLLVAADVDGLEASEGLGGVYRVHGWSAPLALGGVRAWELRALAARLETAGARSAAADSGLRLSAPIVALRAAAARAEEAPGRLLGLVAGVGAALVAFVLAAAGRLRAGLAGERERLLRRGASRSQRALFAVAECAVPAVLGTAGGAALAAIAVGSGAVDGRLGAGELLRFGLGDAWVVWMLALAGPLTLALLLLGCLAPARLAARLADVVLAAGLAAVVALSRNADAGTELPALACVLGALVAARLTPAALRLGGRVPGGGTGRLAALQLARRPAPAMLAVAGLTASIGLGLFALTYRATLERGIDEQAAFRLPLDATLLPGPSLAGPLAETPLQELRALPGVTRASPILRRDAQAVKGPTRRDVTLLGVPPDAVTALGVRVPRGGARRVGLPLRGSTELRLDAAATGGSVEVRAVLRRTDGVVRTVTLGEAGREARTLRGAVPPLWRDGQLTGIAVRETEAVRATSAHQQAEDVEGALVGRGTVRLARVADARGRSLGSLAGWRGAGAVTAVRGGEAGATIAAAVRFDDADGLLRPASAADDAPLEVHVDAATARDAQPGGSLVLAVGGAEVDAAVRGVVARPATVAGERWIVADGASLADAIDAQAPGSGEPKEVWLSGAPPPERLAERTGGVVRTRAALSARLDAEPLGRGTRRALLAAAVLAAVLAAIGLVLAAGGTLRDQAAELADLEADGSPPSTLRRLVGAQIATVGGLGIVAGLAVGAVLTRLAVDAAAGAAGAQATLPPLRTAVAPGPAALGVGLVIVAVAALAATLARRAFREDWPARTTAGEHA